MTYLIDSDRVIDYLAGVPATQALVNTLLPDGIALSIITHYEVYVGIYGAHDPKSAERTFLTFLSGVAIIGIDEDVSKKAAEIRNNLLSRKLQVKHRAIDILIAATAIHNNLTLVTGNQKHFNDILGLTIFQP